VRNRSSFRTLALATCSVAAVSLFASSGLAQASDNCADAPVIGNGSFPFDLNGSTNDGTATCQFPTAGQDVWYRFNATGNGIVTVSTCGGSMEDTMLAAYDGCGGTQLACVDDSCGLQSQISFPVSTGVSYRIRISQFNGAVGSTATGNITVTSNLGSGPINDICTGATAISGTGSFPIDSTLAAADAEDGPAAACGFAGDGGAGDVFYRYTATQTGIATIDTCDSTFDSILQALDACGGAALACNDDSCGLQSRITFDVVNGGVYTIRVSGYQGARGTGNLNVSVSEATTPGDFCSTAFPANGAGAYDFDTTGATIDAGSQCQGNGSNSQWFRYTAATTAFATVETCGVAAFDTVLVAFDECGGTQIACNDDTCGLQSRIGFAATAGEDYFIRISGFGAGTGAGQIVITEAQPAGNDLCANATVATDGSNAFDNTAAGTEGAAACGFGGQPGVNDVWFSYTATGAGNLVVDTCGTGLDTLVSIYDTCGGTEIGCNDDAGGFSACSGTLQSSASTLVTAGQNVIIRIAGWNAAGAGTGNFNISIQEPLVSCVTPPPGATSEGEECGTDTNGGCNNPTQSFFELSPGAVTIAGTAWANGGTRDTDWYRITATSTTRIDATLQSDIPSVLFLVTGVDTCAGIAVVQNSPAPNRCVDIASFSTTVGAGSYAVFVASSFFEGFPCGVVNNYVLTVNSVAVGACCTVEGCTIKSAAECTQISGTYLGDGATCLNDVGYTAATTTTNAFEDVTAVGTGLVLGDDTFQVVDIGFDFDFYGASFTQVSVSSNGYLQFGGTSSIFVNTAIPSAGEPNNCAYGLWDDLNPATGGSITVATLGVAGDRRFVVQYQDIPQFGGGVAVTFEIILFENGDTIEYRYGNIPEDLAGDFTIGVENADGTEAKIVDSATLGTGNTARLFTPSVAVNNCDGGCNPDFNGDGTLDPDDLADFINAFFAQPPNPAADYDGSGSVDPDDLSTYITEFFAGC